MVVEEGSGIVRPHLIICEGVDHPVQVSRIVRIGPRSVRSRSRMRRLPSRSLPLPLALPTSDAPSVWRPTIPPGSYRPPSLARDGSSSLGRWRGSQFPPSPSHDQQSTVSQSPSPPFPLASPQTLSTKFDAPSSTCVCSPPASSSSISIGCSTPSQSRTHHSPLSPGASQHPLYRTTCADTRRFGARGRRGGNGVRGAGCASSAGRECTTTTD